jgi:hypothetical protein
MHIMKQMQPGYTLGWLWKWDYNGDCTNILKWTKRREEAIQQSLEFPAVRALDKDMVKGGFCAECMGHIEELVDVGRRKMWELPGLFDLPPWNQLKNSP